jgi:hypothetical protein
MVRHSHILNPVLLEPHARSPALLNDYLILWGLAKGTYVFLTCGVGRLLNGRRSAVGGCRNVNRACAPRISAPRVGMPDFISPRSGDHLAVLPDNPRYAGPVGAEQMSWMELSGAMNVRNRMMVAVLPAHRENRPLTVKERPQVRFHGTLHGPHDKRSGECDGSFLSCLSRLMPLSRAFRATSASH